MSMRQNTALILDLGRDADGSPSGRGDGKTVGITTGLTPAEVISLHIESGVNHIVQRDGLAFEKEVASAQSMITDPRQFVRQPLDVIFGADGTQGNYIDFSVRASADEKKKHVLHQLEAYLQGLTGARSIREEAMMVADELYTNGSKNAAPLTGDVAPDEISPGWVEFVARADGRRLVLGCIDSYGSLQCNMITTRIQTCFQNGVAQSINQGTGGAGIGSYMIFNAAVSMYIAVEPGQRSVVLCALPLSMRLKETINLPKNLHTVTVPSGPELQIVSKS